MRFRLFFILIFVLFSEQSLFAQKEAYNWVVPPQYLCGFDSGYFHFIKKINMPPSGNTPCISDTSGKFLFNVTNDKILQSNSSIMPNGNNVFSTVAYSQMQIATHPHIDSQSLHYVFVNNNIVINNLGLYYSVVDMNLNSGMGDVVSNRKNVRIGDTIIFNQGIGLARHANNKAWWVIVSKFKSDSVYAYLLDEKGLNMSPVVSVLKGNAKRERMLTEITCSSKSNKVIFSCSGDSLMFLCKFNNQNGVISNQINIPLIKSSHTEFSYSGNYLYTWRTQPSIVVLDTLFQYDIEVHDSTSIVQSKYFYDSINQIAGTLQLGPDRKIYFVTASHTINCIEEPDLKGKSSALSTLPGTISNFQLVQVVDFPWYYSSSRLYTDSFVCLRDSAELRFFHNDFIDSFHVFYDDGSASRHSKNESFVYHPYQTPGLYRPMFVQYYKAYIDTFYTQLTVIQNKPNLGADLHFCGDYELVLNTSDDFVSREWNGSSTADSLMLKDSSYQIILKTVSHNTCKDSDTLSIVRTWMQQEIELNDSIFCFEDLMVLGKQTIKVQNDTLKSRQWLLDGLLIGQSDSVLITYLDAGVHTLKIITTTDSMCIDSTQAQIKVLPFPKVKIHVNDSAQCLNGNAFEFKSIGMLQNNWTGDEGIKSQDSVVNKRYNQAGVYRIRLKAKDSMQCSGEDSLMLWVHLPQNNEIKSSKDTFCEGEQVVLNTRYKSDNVQWNMSDTGNQVSYVYNDSGNYKITMRALDSNLCSSADTLNIRVGHTPGAEIEVEQKTCSQEVTLKENLNQASMRYWVYGHQSFHAFPLTLTLKNETDTVKLMVSGLEGCADTIETIIKTQNHRRGELKIPNVFTPDGDGVNDCYTLEGLNYDCGDEAGVEIYNRWGEIVFKGDLLNTCWNGNLMNKYIDCPSGTYYCLINIKHGTEQELISTTLLLIR